ncbi:MAG: hypothetical protein WCS98_08410 [Bacillota bacterium]|nr:hypothetical protein [Bacillota bacterium]MDD3850997.1 hypothetical protein [Bacillota bacterium]MDD4707139.1 hypothetical protein [Bacillota bacterium]
MVKRDTPRLRTVNKVLPPYELNRFPFDFAYKLGRELVYLLATKGVPSLEGKEWEKTVRLISGRNSPVYSFGETKITEVNPNNLGGQVLSIWNERVSAVRKHYKFVSTVVLLKSNTLEELAVFEFDTIRYDQELYYWQWNNRKNLEGYNKNLQEHCFTWQPHGSQFTIIEKVPNDCLLIEIKKPPSIDKDQLLSAIGFDKSWIKIVRKK